MVKIEISPGKFIGDDQPCFIIAEIGSNHNNDFILAKKLIDAAADAKVDAVKFQTFKAQHHYSKLTPGFSYLDNCNTYNLIKGLELDRSWHAPLKEYAESKNLVFLSSPCDTEAIDDLNNLGCLAYKVASFDLTDLDLISYMVKAGKTIILSTGLANWMDIQNAVNACRLAGNNNIVLLQCTSLYPAPVHLSNLRSIQTMRDAFGLLTGYSDHTEGDHTCLAAVTMGACIIEKHFTLDRSLPGPDHPFAIEPGPLKEMINKIRDIESAMGDGLKTGPRIEEMEMFKKGRRSLHARCNISKGQIITRDMLVTKRPGLGIEPHLREIIIGRLARTDILEDQWITWDMI
ncbi:N-acetylneuraminate synthase family protein [Methanospirillum sp. J.3.6.1-F.2.7.3]|uniref:N-acetylneuraminate synthase family protein n=1 Tax=Methanospirillum purgamenti TaxID=2834276 RepID=A0A8E7B2M2_9EURY|nr:MULTISPECIES: N-acetylneuraminate synthase family protein [Methanospirillum]MDX8549492.1 N-acetylneuraminate synthase family protein [Methanospirillum hungatei]QVV89226.1 N-acetylneuraminate synthase family protein [Methanospirillum sp. J.3.6.1-F.2.7.3]